MFMPQKAAFRHPYDEKSGLAMMIGNAGATNLSPGGLIARGTETGFERVHVRPLIEGITSLLTCTKPGSAGLD